MPSESELIASFTRSLFFGRCSGGSTTNMINVSTTSATMKNGSASVRYCMRNRSGAFLPSAAALRSCPMTSSGNMIP